MKRLYKLRTNKSGALEGLPLYLIILVVVAGIGTAVLAGWMMSSRTSDLGSIELSDSSIGTGKHDVEITAYDQNGSPLEDVTISLIGCGIEQVEMTGSDGTAEFDLKGKLTVPPGQPYGTIEVQARYTGSTTLTETAHITVTS